MPTKVGVPGSMPTKAGAPSFAGESRASKSLGAHTSVCILLPAKAGAPSDMPTKAPALPVRSSWMPAQASAPETIIFAAAFVNRETVEQAKHK